MKEKGTKMPGSSLRTAFLAIEEGVYYRQRGVYCRQNRTKINCRPINCRPPTIPDIPAVALAVVVMVAVNSVCVIPVAGNRKKMTVT